MQVGHSCAVVFDRHGERLRPDRTSRPFPGHAEQPTDLRALARSEIDPQGTSAQAVSGLQTRLLLTALVIVVIILSLVYRGPLLWPLPVIGVLDPIALLLALDGDDGDG